MALSGCSDEVPVGEVEATTDQPEPDLCEEVVDMPADPVTVETREKIEEEIEQDIADEPN